MKHCGHWPVALSAIHLSDSFNSSRATPPSRDLSPCDNQRGVESTSNRKRNSTGSLVIKQESNTTRVTHANEIGGASWLITINNFIAGAPPAQCGHTATVLW